MAEPIITRGRTKIEFPDAGFSAAHPFYGPANSATLREKIRADGLKEPTSGQTVVLAHSLYNGEEPEAKEATDIMRNRYIRGFTGVLFEPKSQLAHFIDYPEFDGSSVVDVNNLLERIEESYVQVPFGKLENGAVNWRDVSKHPYFVAFGHGKEGAERISELASKHSRKEAYIWTPNISNLEKPIARVATLYSGWGGDGLYVSSDGSGVNEANYSFGVFAEGDAQNPKNC